MSNHRRSIFSQSLDRSVFVTFFLGSVVPVIAMAVVTERMLDSLPSRNAQIAALGLMLAVGVLSLVSFFALRRIVRAELRRMNDDNERLDQLLTASRQLGEAPHAQVVLETATSCAAVLGRSEAVWLFTRSHPDKPFSPTASLGSEGERWLQRHKEEWTDLMESAVATGERLVVAPGSETPALIVMPLVGDVSQNGVLVVARAVGAFMPAELDSLTALIAQTSVALLSTDLRDAQRNFFSHMTDMVVAALDAHVQFREGHGSQVARIAYQVGRAMGLDDEALHNLHFAALLHDVGMLRIPTEHQSNPIYFRRHPTIGHKMLSRIKLWEKVAPIVVQHHERMDGGGYPEGLVGEAICLEARILTVCDAWDAMHTADRSRGAMSPEGALADLQRNSDTQFDPKVVAAVARLVEDNELD